MPYVQDTAWRGDHLRRTGEHERYMSNAAHGRHLPAILYPRYAFPIDFLDDERLLHLLGALVREYGLTEQEARIAAAILAGYGSNLYIAGRLGISENTVKDRLNSCLRRLGIEPSEAGHGKTLLVKTLWPCYRQFRPRAYLLQRLDPALNELEPINERDPETRRRRIPKRVAEPDRS